MPIESCHSCLNPKDDPVKNLDLNSFLGSQVCSGPVPCSPFTAHPLPPAARCLFCWWTSLADTLGLSPEASSSPLEGSPPLPSLPDPHFEFVYKTYNDLVLYFLAYSLIHKSQELDHGYSLAMEVDPFTHLRKWKMFDKYLSSSVNILICLLVTYKRIILIYNIFKMELTFLTPNSFLDAVLFTYCTSIHHLFTLESYTWSVATAASSLLPNLAEGLVGLLSYVFLSSRAAHPLWQLWCSCLWWTPTVQSSLLLGSSLQVIQVTFPAPVL